jgi:molybdopterin synthase sulfur carrier subunit
VDLYAVMPPLMFAALVVFLLSGYPVAFSLGAVGIVFGFLGIALDLFPPVAGGGFERTFGAFPPWLLERYLEEWGGTREGEGVYRLPGAVVRFREVEPLKVGSLSIPQLRVEVEGEEAERWFERIAFAASRGGG